MCVMRDDPKNGAELELLQAQRARLASRLRTPWWYVAATTLAWAVAFAMPIGSHYLTGAGIGGALLAIAVFLLAQQALARASGVDLGLVTWKYPSGRAWTIATVLVIFAADGVEAPLLDHGLLPAAIVVGALATLAGTACWHGHLQGLRRDLEAGRAAT
jgi:hypothetical protein